MISTYIFNIHNGVDTAYIYIWLSKSYSVIYVGMTNNIGGTIGRAEGHFNRKGTFRKRFQEKSGLGIEKVVDLILLSFSLPKKREYTGVESSYRESVEYLVRKKLLLMRNYINPSYDIISWHDRFPRRTQNSEVIKIANQITDDFIRRYSTL